MPGLPGNYLTSTPACLLSRASEVFTPEEHRKSMSPITRSAQRMSRAMQVSNPNIPTYLLAAKTASVC